MNIGINFDKCDEETRQQIETALEDDTKRIGDVYRSLTEHNDDYDAIAEDLGLENIAGIYAYVNYIRAIFQDFNTTSTRKASQTASQINSFIKRHSSYFDDRTIDYLEDSYKFYFDISQEDENILKEAKQSKTKFEEIASKDRIYVYSYPHYVDCPHIETEDGFSDARYMLKIGRTTNDAYRRMLAQKTSMPEDPVLYYVFTLGKSQLDLETAEKMIHQHLKTIGHRRKSDAGGGTEWFLTNFESVISIAEMLQLDLESEESEEDD